MAEQINLEVPDFSKDYMDVKVGWGLHDSPYVGKDTKVISLGVEKTIHTTETGNVDLV